MLTTHKYLFNLLFSDDQVIITHDEYDFDYIMRNLLDVQRKWELNINFGKSEYFGSDFKGNFRIEGKVMHNVFHFTNLGSERKKHLKSELEIRKKQQQQVKQ